MASISKKTPRTRKLSTTAALPLSSMILYRYTMPEGAVVASWYEKFAAADRVAQRAMQTLTKRDAIGDDLCEAAAELVSDREREADARRFLVEYFRSSGEPCTSPEDAADELVRLAATMTGGAK